MSRLFFGLLLNCIILAGLISAKSVADYGDGKPFHLKLTEAELRGIETGQRLDYEYSEDVGQFVDTISMYNSAETALGKKLVCNVDVQCSNAKPENQLWNDSLSVFVLCFILFILGLLFFGTCYDLYVARPLEAETEHQRNKQKRHELIKQSLKADTD
uniref:Uncharacterized protein n=1 Tax=Ditylenchus dipsaci TaxID=166011 RepID=A0A915DLR7_9BILA